MDTFLERLLNDRNMGFAYLDSECNIVFNNSVFQNIITNKTSLLSRSIFDLIPETIGLEHTLNQIVLNREKRFSVDLINRLDANKQPLYFNLIFMSTGDSARPLFCLMENQTESAKLKQKNIQQKHDIKLLESLLSNARENTTLKIIGDSEPIKKLRHLIDKISNIPSSSVFLAGESGTGKNLTARIIHEKSNSENAPFIEINCAAIPENLLESELFGYEKGAFTTASSSKKGLIEEAEGGTLLLDEIAELSLKLQTKLLSFLETKKFRRLGSNNEIEVNLRLIAATNRDLKQMSDQGTFRNDLFYRLNVVSLFLPALKDTNGDILLLAKHFIMKFNIEFHKKVKGLAPKAASKIMQYHWPGNVRELSNAIERAMLFTDSSYISDEDILLYHEMAESTPKWEIPPEGFSIEELEKDILMDSLKKSQGNISKAARLIGITRDTFRYRLNKYNIELGDITQ